MTEMRSSGTVPNRLPRVARWLGRLFLVALGFALLLNTPRQGRAANTVVWSEVSQPASSGTFLSVAFGDVNEDGHLDLVAGRRDDGISVFAGDGTGGWTSLPAAAASGTYYDLALGDANNDGKLDLVAAHDGSGVHYWTGDGAGGWSKATAPVASGQFRSMTLGDIDRDGNLDVAAGSGEDLGLKVWLGNGTGGWTAASTGLPGAGTYPGVAIGDVNRDGSPDLVAAGTGKGVRAWKGSGSGSWTEQAAGLPASGVYLSVALGDLDNDGDLDIVASSDGGGVAGWTVSGGLTWSWLGASAGLPDSGTYWGIAVGDVDNDGKLDIASGSFGGGVAVWSGDGGGAWSKESAGLPASGKYTDVALGDLDDDGLPDLVAGRDEDAGVRAWRDAGAPDTLEGWQQIASPTTAGLYWSVDTGDLDRDGKLDIVAASEGNGIQLWTGDGGNGWDEVSAWTSPDLPTSGSYRSIAFGEIEHNGYPDVVAGSGDGGGLHVWLFRDASAWNEASTGLPGGGTYRGIDLGDFNNDGYLDIAGVGEDLGVRAWTAVDFDTASGTWMAASSGLPSSGTYNCVALGDLDNDGNLDIVAGSNGSGVLVWEGDGPGGWTAQKEVIDSGSWLGVAVGDVDDDGTLDVVAASDSAGVRAWAGDGGFGWVSLAAPAINGDYASVALGDLDNDGHLDVAAGTGSDAGPTVWRGDGGTAWAPYSTYLPNLGDYTGVAFGDVDNDGVLDLIGARYGGGSVHVWTGAEGAPPSRWDSFSPSSWVSLAQQADCSVQVQDTGSGLDVDSAEYRFLGAEGTWNAWQAASCSGSDGTTEPQTLTALNVPFNQDSGPAPYHEGNWVQLRVADVSGNTGYSDQYVVYIDTTPPINPTHFPDSSHWPGGACESDDTVWVEWGGAEDATSGLDGYSYLFSASTSLPDTTVDTWMHQATSAPLADGYWYLSVRTHDTAGNWAAGYVDDGPYCVDTTPPTNPTDFDSMEDTGRWTSDDTVYAWWSGEEDALSGVYGYSLDWTTSPLSIPDQTVDTIEALTMSEHLGDSASWHLHVRTRDNAGNWASGAAHYGPFMIETTPPLAWINMTSHEATSNPFPVLWNGWDGLSGLWMFDVQTSTNGIDWEDWLWHTVDFSGSYMGTPGETVYFRVRAIDYASNPSDWTAPFDITLGVDVTVRVEDEWGTPLHEAVVYLNGEEQGTTAPDGTLVVHGAVVGDELAAKYLVDEHPAIKAWHDWPDGSNWAYRTYITNVDFDADGNPLIDTVGDTHTTQVLVVRRDNPLVGFHIVVSVEWGAGVTFLNEVADGFRSASEYLFDLTDGQMVFEAVHVYGCRAFWDDADYQIYANNTQWPHGDGGGIWLGPGAHVELGRYFSGLTSDRGPWDRPFAYLTLVHEFGHYGFDLDDEYVDSHGVRNGGCTTDRDTTPAAERACFMDDHFDGTEICSALSLHPHNTDTWQHVVHAEPCWNTVERQYRSPTDEWLLERPQDRGSIMPGPWGIPVADWTYTSVTHASCFQCPAYEVTWHYPTGEPVADAIVWVENVRLLMQGRTQEDGSITILGAHHGDTVELSLPCGHFCSYSDSVPVSCDDSSAQVAQQHTVQRDPFGLHVGAVPRDGGDTLEVRVSASEAVFGNPAVVLWQDGSDTPLQVGVTYDSATQTYTGTVSLDTELGLSGLIWVAAYNQDGQRVTAMTPFQVERVAHQEHAMLASENGNLELYLQPGTLTADTAVSIMPNRAVSTTQDSLALVGGAYEVSVSSGQVSLGHPAAVNMRYHSVMATGVVPGTMQVYTWNDGDQRWVALGGSLDPGHNLVSAQTDHLSTFAILGRQRGEFEVYLPVVLKAWDP